MLKKNIGRFIFTEAEALAETPTSNLNTPGTHAGPKGIQNRPTFLFLISFLLRLME